MKLGNKRIISLILAFVMLFSMVPMTAFASGSGEIKENLWNGRSALFVGDSITEGIGTTKIYYQFLSETLGFSSVNAMGVAGSCISAASDYGQGNQPLINRYQKIPSTDLIVIYMGTNDYGHETPLGSVEDTQDVSFYGALNTIIPALVAKHSSSKIVFVTPIHRYGFGTSKILGTQFTADSLPNGVGATLGDYVEALITVCANNGVSVIDLYTEWTLNPADSEVQSNYMPDGLHPNAAGHELIAEIMEPHIRSYAPVEKAPAVENEPEEKTELIYGNKFVSSFSQENRASSRVNQYLKAGTVITLKNPDIFQWACTKTSDENSCDNLGYFPNGSWSDQKTAVVANDGWIGFVFKYRDETRSFDLTKPLSDYITIEAPHAHTYEATVSVPTCTEQGYTTYTCDCGDSYVDDYADATGHTYENGICTGCGASHPNLAKYEGKVISILGDSISTFAGYIPIADGFNLEHYARYPQANLFSDVEHTWWMQVLTTLDANLGINESWRSTEVGNIYDVEVNSGYEGTKACMASTTRIQNLGSNGTPDVILFYGGTNDITQRRNVGTFDPSIAPAEVDLTSVKWDTVAEAYVTAIMRMQYYYPDAEIVAMLPTFTYKNTNAVIEEYNSVFAKICKHYNVNYIDLRDCGITTADLPDGTHPDEIGMDYITAAVLDALLTDCNMEEGENKVYSVTHILTGAESSLSYYKGVSNGKSFETTLTGEDLTVTVTMGDVDITNDCYAKGVVSIASVTGDVVITAVGKEKTIYVDHLQQLPDNLCSGLNLWDALKPENQYYASNGWGNVSTGQVWSITIPVVTGDHIYANSFEKNGSNGNNYSSTNGIRVAYFDADGVYKSLSPAEVYAEFAANGYLTIPENVSAICVPMWTNTDESAVYILNRDHIYDNGTCLGCGNYAGPVITHQSESVEQEIGKKFDITVKAEGEGLTYQWYYKDAGMKNFGISSNKTPSYAYTMQSYMHNRQVYCVINDANGNSVKTEVATITRPPQKLTILEQPKDATAALGERFSIAPKVQGDDLTYQWYVKEAGAKAFKPSSNKTATYAYTMQSYMKGRQVYCVITDKYGNSVTTDTATISLPPVELKIVEQPADVNASKGEKYSIKPKVQGDGLTYQWYYKESYMKTFKPSSNKTAAYAYAMQNYMNDRSVYCVITDQYGNQAQTEVVIIHLEK